MKFREGNKNMNGTLFLTYFPSNLQLSSFCIYFSSSLAANNIFQWDFEMEIIT